MKSYSSNLFKDIRYESSLIFFLSLTDPDILRHSKVTDDELNVIKTLALEKIYRQRILKEYFAVSILE